MKVQMEHTAKVPNNETGKKFAELFSKRLKNAGHEVNVEVGALLITVSYGFYNSISDESINEEYANV